MSFFISTLLFILFDQVQKNFGQNFSPVSPCPKIFQYRFDGNEWFGHLLIKSFGTDEPLKVKLTLSLVGKPKTNYLGDIELLTRGQYKTGTLVAYKVKFPKSDFLPNLQQISVNNRIVCFGRPDHSVFVTQISLEHNRNFKLVPVDTRFDVSTSASSPSEASDVPEIDIFNVNNNIPAEHAKNICGKSVVHINNFQVSDNANFDVLKLFSDSGQVPLINSDELFTANGQQQKTEQQPLTSIIRGAWPWLAAIYVNNMTSLAYRCSGTLVSSRIVVSAAHCLHLFNKRYKSNEVLVFLGRHNLKNWNEQESVAASCEDIFIHPDYDNHLVSYDADIAVLVLRTKVSFNSFIQPACLWSGSSEFEYIEGERGVVATWGLSGDITSETMAIPKLLSVPIVSNDVCFNMDVKFRSISSNRTFCAGEVKSVTHHRNQRKNIDGPCVGDSGAGLMIRKNQRWMLRGVVSASLPITSTNSAESTKLSCNWNRYVIYADVAKFLDWIYSFTI